jgi:polyether ionophore transport system permease protein
VLWALTAAGTIAAGSNRNVDLSVADSAFYALMVSASAAMFLAVGALTSQLASTRRQASGLAAGVFALCLVIRMIADSVSGLGWLRWLSPLGWVENLHPLTGSQPLALVPIVLLIVAASMLAVMLSARRDVGTGLLTRQQTAGSDTRLLDSPALLVVRVERWVALGWVAGLALLALVFGIVARSAATASPSLNRSLVEQVGRLGGHHVTAATAWIGYEFLYIAALVAFAAAGQISAMRNEEADGHLDNLLARYLRRSTWVDGRLRFGTALVVAIGLSAAFGGWIGVASGGTGVGFTAMLQAGLNLMPAALFILGLGTLLFGLVPRLALPILYALILWSFLVEIVGSSITSNRLLLDTALFSHLGPVPATSLNWTAIGTLTGLGALTAIAGIAAFQRRDLVAA